MTESTKSTATDHEMAIAVRAIEPADGDECARIVYGAFGAIQDRHQFPRDFPTFEADGKTVFVANNGSGTVSTIDVKTRAKNPTDIPVGPQPIGVAVTPDGKPLGVAVTPDGKTVFVTQPGSGTVSTIETRTKNPSDIAVGVQPGLVSVTPDGKTAPSPIRCDSAGRELSGRHRSQLVGPLQVHGCKLRGGHRVVTDGHGRGRICQDDGLQSDPETRTE